MLSVPLSLIDIIEFQMTTIFGGSRLANLREKRTSGDQNTFNKEEPLKLGLTDDIDKVKYQPSTSTGFGRSHTRLLKGRIQRGSNCQNVGSNYANQESHMEKNENLSKEPPKLTTTETSEQFRLVINDDPKRSEQRRASQTNPTRTTQKRILISKESDKEHSVQKKFETPHQPVATVTDIEPQKPKISNNTEDMPIRQEDVEESVQQNENDLVQCPQGCGRKFNRKALEKHAKACKLVFMSKRKEFNSQAKRFVNKEQETLAKQLKAKEKKDGKGKGKAFQKTGENWKAASEDFRAAIKAIKKESTNDQPTDQADQEKPQEEIKIIQCKFCDKPFAQIFIEKHLEGCSKKKEEKKKGTKKK